MNPTTETTQPPALGLLSKIRQIVLILLGMILMGSVAWILVKKFNQPETSAAGVVSVRLDKLKAKKEAEQKAAETYGWVDKNTGVVHIPVDKAVELTIPELKAKPVTRTNFVPVPNIPAAPATAAAPATPTSPAPAATAAPAAPKGK